MLHPFRCPEKMGHQPSTGTPPATPSAPHGADAAPRPQLVLQALRGSKQGIHKPLYELKRYQVPIYKGKDGHF